MGLLYSHFVIRVLLAVVIAGVLSSGCGRNAGAFPLPAQHSLNLGHDPGLLTSYVNMDDPASDDHIVRDISPGRDHHRWAFQHPELRFRMTASRNLIFAAEFAIPEATFKTTGPVKITVAVNGRELGTFRASHSGDYRMQLPVPAGVVEPGKEAHVTMETEPRWVSPEDGAQLSFFLRGAGFIQQ